MKTKYLAFAAAAFMLASCSNDEDFVPQDDLKDTPITVTADVADLKTRAGYDTENLPATFYLTMIQDTEDATSLYNYTNVEMTKDEGATTYSAPEGTTLLWKDGNHEAVAFNAYTTDGTTFTVQTNQSTAANVLASDLLGAVKTDDDETSDIDILGHGIYVDFRHLLCKLDVTYSWGTEFASTTNSITKVKYVGFGSDVTLDRSTAAITNGTGITEISAFVTGQTSEAIFAPQSATPKIVITAMIDNVERIFSINVTAPTDGFVSGNRYAMNVTIGGTATETGEIGIAEGWETGDANGEAEGTNGNMETN